MAVGKLFVASWIGDPEDAAIKLQLLPDGTTVAGPIWEGA